MKDTVRNFLNILVITFLILDSGGGLKLRNISFLIILLFALYGIYKYRAYNKKFICFYLIFMLTLIPGIWMSFVYSISILKIFNWIISFSLMPLFYFYVKGSKLSQRSFVIAGFVFSIIVIFLFFGRLMNINTAILANDYITSHSDGFFGNKKFLSGGILPNVYFQGTLSVIICGCLSLKDKNYFMFFVILVGLIIAPPRFGFVVLIFWAGFLFFKKTLRRLIYLPFIMIVCFMILQNLDFGKELFSVFTNESDSLDIRNGHFISIYNIFSQNPIFFLIGQGPGTFFYTYGTHSLTDNIEISQLEYIRKYGIFSFLAFILFYFLPIFGRLKSDIFVKGALLLYFVVSFSNPVLFSVFSMLFLTFSYIEVFNNNNIIIRNV